MIDDNPNIKKLRYTGTMERMVFLKRRQFTVKQGDEFTVSLDEAKKFIDKEEFKEV